MFKIHKSRHGKLFIYVNTWVVESIPGLIKVVGPSREPKGRSVMEVFVSDKTKENNINLKRTRTRSIFTLVYHTGRTVTDNTYESTHVSVSVNVCTRTYESV